MLQIIQNDPEVPPGIITEQLDHLGIFFATHHPYLGDPLPELRDVSALIVLGGAMGANDDARHPFLRDLKSFIRQAVQSETPYLGICLGGQLLAAAFKARVVSNRWEELGTLDVRLTDAGRHDRLFSGVDELFTTFQWHHDSFDLPEGATLLAASAACPHQAFRVGDTAWGTQFHPEVTEKIIRDWCAWDSATRAGSDAMVARFRAAGQSCLCTAHLLIENFLKAARLYAVKN